MDTLLSKSGDNYKVPLINWAHTPIYEYFTDHQENAHVLAENANLYTEGEIDYVLDTIKKRYDDFQHTDIMKPFFDKSLSTLEFLLLEQTLDPIYRRVS